MTPYDSPDYHALIRGIREIDRAGGDSTLARLVTADWLEENGEWERAALIRGFAETGSALRVSGNDGTTLYFGQRIGLPIQIFSDRYLVGFPRPADVVVSSDGLVFATECPLAWWLAHGPDLCRRHPVREVAITGVGPLRRPAFSRWSWGREMAADARLPPALPAVLPAAIFDRLELGSMTGMIPGTATSEYHSPKTALEDLNTTALRWAEAEAEADRPVTSPSPSPPA